MAIKWHEIFAAVQQEHLAPVNIAVTSEFEITSLPPRGDILFIQPANQTGWSDQQRDYLPDGIRDSLAEHHILELKYTEAVNQEVFDQVVGYGHFYRQSRKLAREQVRCFILSSYSTDKQTRQTFGYTQMSHPGVYHSDNPLLVDIPLLLLNELSDTPHNVLFKLFGSRSEAKLSALWGLREWWLERLPERLLLLLQGLVKHWFGQEEVLVDVMTPEQLIEEGKTWRDLVVQLTPYEQLLSLLQDSPFVQQLQAEAVAEGEAIGKAIGKAIGEAKGEAKGEARGEAIGGIVEALVIRFEAERSEWRTRLIGLPLAQLEALRQAVLTVDSLAEFETLWKNSLPTDDDRA